MASGELAGRQNPTKDNGVISLSLRWLSIVASGEGGGGGAKILQEIMAPPLSVIKMVKYCDVAGGGGALGALKPTNIMAPPSLSSR